MSAPRRARPRSRATKRAYCRRYRPVDAPDTRRQSPVQQGTVTVAGRGAGTQQNIFLLPRASPSVGLGVWYSTVTREARPPAALPFARVNAVARGRA